MKTDQISNDDSNFNYSEIELLSLVRIEISRSESEYPINPIERYRNLSLRLKIELGSMHAETLSANRSFAESLHEMGFLTEALEFYSEIALIEYSTGVCSTDVSDIYRKQIDCFDSLGDRKSTIKVYKLLVDFQKQKSQRTILDEQDMELRIEYARYLTDSGEYHDAKKTYSALQREFCFRDEVESPLRIEILLGLASCNRRLSFFKEAAIQYEICVDTLEVTLGQAKYDPLVLLQQSAWCFEKAREYAKASSMYSKVIESMTSRGAFSKNSMTELKYRQRICDAWQTVRI